MTPGHTVPPHAGLCDWDPKRGKPAQGIPLPNGGYADYTGCRNKATVRVGGRKIWHLCASCASLGIFKRYRKRVALPPNYPGRVAPAAMPCGARTILKRPCRKPAIAGRARCADHEGWA